MRVRRPFFPVLLALAVIAGPCLAWAQPVVSLSVGIAPPPLPVYAQPPIPGPGYIWIPGYWAWGPYGYYWVPGTWVLPPGPGLLWTPGYWAGTGVIYQWHPGYWGPRVGYYGGIRYGFGYNGIGYVGGYWAHGTFYYNRAYNNVHRAGIATYNKPVGHHSQGPAVAYAGGHGGTTAQPTPQDQAALRQEHTPPTAIQMQHEQAAGGNRALFASNNHGKPPVAGTTRPGEFTHGVVPAKGAAPHGAPPPHGTPPEHGGGPAGGQHNDEHHQ
jgi:hypothetical protein